MANYPQPIRNPPSNVRHPYRLAWLLACVTFPLIWVGGLVTTYGAGMAVPDWPNTYGYNLFLYPLKSWLGVWDVFLEHSHRLIGAAAGMVTILLALALWRWDPRRWMKWLGLAAVAGVSFQGVLGGLRVIQNEILLAKIHGCTAPVFFALTAALVVFASPRWRESPAPADHPAGRRLQRLAVIVTLGIYLQIVLGAQLRHLPLEADAHWLALWIYVHLIVAGLVAWGVVWLLVLVAREFRQQPVLVRRAWILFALFQVQLVLGALTWVSKYGWPAWFHDYVWPMGYTVQAGGRLQGAIVTAHVGIGSLALVASLSIVLWSLRLLRKGGSTEGTGDPAPMAVCPLVPASQQPPCSSSLRGYWDLARPRIVAMVLFAMAVAALVSDRTVPSWRPLVHALAGTALVIVGAITLNQRIEHRSDAKMARTVGRPLPSGRLSDRQAAVAGLLATGVGLAYLGWLVNTTILVLAALSWAIYVWLYTPLKMHSAWQTPVGAVAGAMPVLLGAAATGALLNPTALTLFGALYFWQFPHAMAIAWLGRRDFAAAELRVATVVDPSGRIAARLSLLGAAALVPISLVPCWLGPAGWEYAGVALVLNAAYVLAAVRFLLRTDDRAARTLLRVSLLYLPVVLIALVLASRG